MTSVKIPSTALISHLLAHPHKQPSRTNFLLGQILGTITIRLASKAASCTLQSNFLFSASELSDYRTVRVSVKLKMQELVWITSPRLSSSSHLPSKDHRRRSEAIKRPLGQNPGCLKCRTRKKKCDGRRPTCLGCERNVLLCNWPQEVADSACSLTKPTRRPRYQPSSPFSPSLSEGRNGDTDSSSPMSHSSSASARQHTHKPLRFICQPALGGRLLKDPNSSMLYEHWINHTANALSASRGPLALSGIYYGNKNNNNVIRQLTYTHLGQALQALKYGLTKHVSGADSNALRLLVTTLIFCFLETVRGDDKGNLKYHLRAAQQLLFQVLASQTLRHEEPLLEFLKEYYAYIAHITELSTDMDVSSDADCFSATQPLTSDKSSGMLFGCAHKLFEMVPQISAFAREQNEPITNASRFTMDQLQLEEELYLITVKRLNLRSRIQAWQPPLGCDKDFELCGRIYQQALLVYNNPPLPPILSNSTCEDSFTRQSIENVVRLLDRLPVNAPISATLIWPLAFLGTLAEDISQRNTILARLQGIWNTLSLGNARATIDFLDRYWSDEAPAQQAQKKLGSRLMRCHQGHLELLMERYGLDISFV
ncbi:fungal-specific transcription factor domain-containing protein [Xylogone sp. PMI_703]|nr:fungal-specific transcription factor domain-containing protein [Xylogone sp. PMI_703]